MDLGDKKKKMEVGGKVNLKMTYCMVRAFSLTMTALLSKEISLKVFFMDKVFIRN